MSFVFELDAYCENGHAPRRSRASPRDGRRRSASRRARARSMHRRSQRIEVACAARERVPLPAPAERPVARQVGLVGDRPVGVALRVRRLAAAVRLDAVADLAGASPRARTPAGSPRSGSGRRGSTPVAIRCAPITPEKPDVDHVRVADVEPDPEAGRGTRSPRSAPRPARRSSRAARGRLRPIQRQRASSQTMPG